MQHRTIALVAGAIVASTANADVIAFQDFEGASTDTWAVTTNPEFYGVDGTRIWDILSENGQITGAYEGDNFLGGRNTGSAEYVVSFDDLDISNYENVSITFAFNAFGFETGDYIDYTLNGLRERAFTGLPTGTDSTDDWESLTINLTSVDAIDFGFITRVVGSGDRFGIDTILVSGDLVPAPGSNALMALGLGVVARRRRA